MIHVLEENSIKRRIWDSLILVLILISCVLIPYQVVFHGKVFGKIVFFLYTIDLIFFLDIWLNFRTTFRQEGREITDRKKISSNYLRTTFIIDLISNFPFELVLLLHMNANVKGISLIVIIRMLRLLRIGRMFLIFHRWERTGLVKPSYLRIIKFSGVMGFLLHWLACGWFLVASIENFPVNSWVVRAGIKSADSITQYIRSLYWTITTMTTVGYGDITPISNWEYIVAMIVMLLGASMYAFIIGNVASLLSHLDSGKVTHWNRMESVTEYLRSRHISRKLVTRVRDYYEYQWTKHRGIKKDTLISDLPESLRLDLLLNLAKDLLENVPLFKYCSPSLRDVLLIALKQKTYDPGSYIVQKDDVGKKIFFISQGTADIIKDDKVICDFENGDYFGHMSILLKEKRTASVIATGYCELFELSESDYHILYESYPELKDVMKKMSSGASEKQMNMTLEGIVL